MLVPSEAFAQDGCTYQPNNTSRRGAGTIIFGSADWNCNLADGIYWQIHVEIRLNGGPIIKKAEFSGTGSVNSEFTTGVPCTPELNYYSVFTYGIDGSAPTVWPAKEGYENAWACP